MAHQLTKHEREILEGAYDGQPVKLTPHTIISAQFLRDHILEIASPEVDTNGHQRSYLSWIIYNAVFTDLLDLCDGRRSSGGSLPAIEFHSCEFQGGFKANGAYFDRLTFHDCKFISKHADSNCIYLRNCRIGTELRFEALKPVATSDAHPPDAGLLWVDAFAISVGTNFVVQDTLFRAPKTQASSAAEARHALDLSTANVHCDLHLQPRVVLIGGLKMRDTRVGGTVWAQGLHADDGESKTSRAEMIARGEKPRHAFRAHSAHIKGGMWLTTIDAGGKHFSSTLEQIADADPDPIRFWCQGAVDLTAIHIEGELGLSGAFIGGTPYSYLDLRTARLAGGWVAPAFVPEATLDRVKRKQKLVLEVEQYVSLASCRISGDCFLDIETSNVFAGGVTVGGNLTLNGSVKSLQAGGLEVGKDTALALRNIVKCDLHGSNLKGVLDIAESWFASGGTISMSLRDADIGHTLRVSPVFWKIAKVRQRPLTCYKGFTLSEIVPIADTDSRQLPKIASFIHRDKNLVTLLDGQSERLHEVSRAIELKLPDEEAARDFLRLFAAYTWAENGAFTIIEDADALPSAFRDKLQVHPIKITEGKANKPGEFYFFDAFVRYGLFLYRAKFEVRADGNVQMIDDQLVKLGDKPVVYRESEVPMYSAPFRLGTLKDPPDHVSESTASARKIDLQKFVDEIPDWSERLVEGRLTNVYFDLRGATCGTLNDNAGKVWEGAPPVELEEFKYDVMFLPPRAYVEDEIEARLRWLSGLQKQSRWQQFKNRAKSALNVLYIDRILNAFHIVRDHLAANQDRPFRAQPYTQLASAFRKRGDEDASRDVEAAKIRLDTYDRASTFKGRLSMVMFWWWYGTFFRYGLAPLRAFFVLILLWLMGTGLIKFLDVNDLLRANVNTVASAAIIAPKGDVVPIVPLAPKEIAVQKLHCGDTISPALYAAELIIPVLNLHQEGRCEIRRSEAQDENKKTLIALNHACPVYHWMTLPLTWEYIKAVYILLGTIFSSLALVTFSGIARRWERSSSSGE